MTGNVDYRPNRPRPWRARYVLNGHQHSKSFKLKRDANAWLRREIEKLDRGEITDPQAGKTLYAGHAERWINGLVDLKPKTRLGYENLLHSRVLPTFGSTPIKDIDMASVRDWIASMHRTNLSASRIRQARQVLGASLQMAVDDGHIGKNPTKGTKVPVDHPRKPKYLTVIQLRELEVIADGIRPGAGRIIRFLGLTGLRWGEMVALRRSAINMLKSELTVTESASEVQGRIDIGRPKTHRERTVNLGTTIRRDAASALEGRTDGPDPLLFTAPQGGYLRSSNWRRSVWKPATTALVAMYPELAGLRIHDLRHTAASLAISCNANIKVVQRMLGHRSATVTLDRYGHLYGDDLQRVANQLDEHYMAAA